MQTVVSDSFDRADGPLGTADTGQVWAYAGCLEANWAISGNVVISNCVFTSGQHAYVDAGVVPKVVRNRSIYKNALAGSHLGHMFRGVDNTNFWAQTLYSDGGGDARIVLSVWNAGSPTWDVSATISGLVDGSWHTLETVDYGTYVESYFDGLLVDTRVDSTHNAGTRVGLCTHTGSNGPVDDLYAGIESVASGLSGLSGLSALSGVV